jgi:hypothetical protein
MAINLPIISEWNPKGIDKAIADFKKLETNGERAAFAIKKAAVPAGLALAAMGAFAFSAVKAFGEDEIAASKLAKTLENTTGASDAQVKSIEDFITKTSIAAAVADDELRPALDKLVRGTKDVNKAQDLLGLALDISAGTGKDLGSVSDALSKAFNGQLGPLKKLSPELTALIKNGASTDEVFAALGKTFSGQASTAANTTQGKMKSLGIQMGEFKESIGAIIAPLAMKLVPALQKFGDWATKHKTTIVVIAGVIAGLAAAILLVNAGMAAWNALQAVTAAVNAVTTASFSALWVATGAVVILAVIAALVVLQAKFDIFGKAIDGIKKGFDILWGAVKWVFDWIKDHWEALLIVLTGPFGLAVVAVVKFKDDVINFIKGVISWIGDNWKLLVAVITGPFGLAFSAILFFKDSVVSVFNSLKDLAGKVFDGVGGAFKGVINGVISGLEGGLNFAIKGLNKILDGIDKAAGPWVNFGSIPEVKLPRLAEGGIVMNPTIAMIGEAGPEAVIPLNKMNSVGGGQTINIYNSSADPMSVVQALQQYIRDRGALPITVNSTAFRG